MPRRLVSFTVFFLITCFLTLPSAASAQETVQDCRSPDEGQYYTTCLLDPSHIICGTPVYACCFVPPASIGIIPQCPLPPPACSSPNQCIDASLCPDNYELPVSTQYCPVVGMQIDPVCCAPTGAPPPTPGPSPTPYIGPPPDFCGDHLQPCCGIVSGGDPGQGTCDPQPVGQPSLFCTSIALGESVCCLQNDPEPRCYTGIGVTPIPPPSSDTSRDVFCTSANGNPTSVTTKWIYTALGCLEYDAYRLVASLLILLTRVAGGIGLIFLILSAFQFITAGGDPKKVQAGKELLASSLVGLSLIVLSIVILNFIGVNVLGLPSFGFSFTPN